jgi:hypothetical protein
MEINAIVDLSFTIYDQLREVQQVQVSLWGFFSIFNITCEYR